MDSAACVGSADAAGIFHAEEDAGYFGLIYEPHPDERIGWLDAKLNTRRGTVRARWNCEDGGIRYTLETLVDTVVRIGGKEEQVKPGRYTFWQSYGDGSR